MKLSDVCGSLVAAGPLLVDEGLNPVGTRGGPGTSSDGDDSSGSCSMGKWLTTSWGETLTSGGAEAAGTPPLELTR